MGGWVGVGAGVVPAAGLVWQPGSPTWGRRKEATEVMGENDDAGGETSWIL